MRTPSGYDIDPIVLTSKLSYASGYAEGLAIEARRTHHNIRIGQITEEQYIESLNKNYENIEAIGKAATPPPRSIF